MKCKHMWEYQGTHKQKVYPGFAEFEFHEIYWCNRCGAIKKIHRNPVGDTIGSEHKLPTGRR